MKMNSKAITKVRVLMEIEKGMVKLTDIFQYAIDNNLKFDEKGNLIN